MRATDFEFRYRFWIFGAVFWVPFLLYSVDHQNAIDPLARWLGLWDGLNVSGNEYLILWVAAACALLCAAIRLWATAYLRATVVQDANLRSDRLVADGPYRFVRNPLYLGNIFLACAVAPMASRLGSVVMILLMLLYCLRLIGREEAGLLATQGENYAEFRSAVPMLIPALIPRLPASGAHPQWRQAILGESFMLAFCAGVVAFAITQDMRWFFVATLAGFGCAGLFQLWMRRKSSAKNGDAAGS